MDTASHSCTSHSCEHLPAVSIIIPSFNCARFLPTTLASVFAQTYRDFEVIVVDDGSTDNTSEVLAPFGSRLVCIKKENGGLSAARNTGIRKARGEFIALLDADDSWTPDKLARQMPFFEDSETGIVASDFSVQYADGRFQRSYLIDRPLAGEGFVFDNYIQSRFLFPSSMILRRSCLDQCGLFDESMLACEDIDLFARICLHWKVALVNVPLMIRYEGLHNITANHARMSLYTIRALVHILEKEPHLPESSRVIVHRELSQQYWWNGYAAFTSRDMATARRSMLMAIRYDKDRVRTCLPLMLLSFLPTTLIRRLRSQAWGW